MSNPSDPEITYDPETDVLKIFGIEYRASIFRGQAFLPIGTYLRIEARKVGTVVTRGFSDDLQLKFNTIAGIK